MILTAFTTKAQINLIPDTVGICKGDTAFLEGKSNSFSKTASYHWRTPTSIKDNYKILPAREEGKYYLRVNSNNTSYTDSCYVKYFERPKLKFNDTLICNSSTALIGIKNTSYSYLWSTDETTPRIRIETPGKYSVKISNKGCSVTQALTVNFYKASTPSFGNEVTFCMSDDNKVLSIKPSAGSKITWSNGSNANSIIPYKEGVYWVRTESKTCGVSYDSVKVKLKACDCEILIPNSFTPNEDGKNDYFFPVLNCEYSYYNFTIEDRWDNTVFATNNVNSKWDGRFKGNLCPDDIYFYRIETIERNTGKKTARNGQISLFR